MAIHCCQQSARADPAGQVKLRIQRVNFEKYSDADSRQGGGQGGWYPLTLRTFEPRMMPSGEESGLITCPQPKIDPLADAPEKSSA